jgi:hypothetical protein
MGLYVDGWYVPTLCSEREPDGTFEDCAWASGVTLANAAEGDEHPPTQAEYQALRAISGDDPVGSSSLTALKLGMDRRYGYHGIEIRGALAVTTVPVGTAVLMFGPYGALPDHFRRWDLKYTDGHVAVGLRTSAVRWWWLDPLATRGYPGEAIPAAAIARFVGATGGALKLTIGGRTMQIEHKIERWTLDGGPGKITTLGAPYLPDGTVDYKRRLAITSGLGGLNRRLEFIARSRLTAPDASQDVPLYRALTTYDVVTEEELAAAIAADRAKARIVYS